MKRTPIALAAGLSLTLLCGLEVLSTTAFAQDDFGRDRDRPIFERDRERSQLPSAATLLGSGDTECRGALLASGIGRDGDDVHSIAPGEARIFRVARQNVPWACLDATTARSNVMECPRGTTDVRISHEGTVARFECYGTGN